MKIETGISEEEQLGCFQNATLHGATDRIACSIAIIPKYPESLTSEAEIAEYLKSELELLSKKGWDIQVQMGLSSDFEQMSAAFYDSIL